MGPGPRGNPGRRSSIDRIDHASSSKGVRRTQHRRPRRAIETREPSPGPAPFAGPGRNQGFSLPLAAHEKKPGDPIAGSAGRDDAHLLTVLGGALALGGVRGENRTGTLTLTADNATHPARRGERGREGQDAALLCWRRARCLPEEATETRAERRRGVRARGSRVATTAVRWDVSRCSPA